MSPLIRTFALLLLLLAPELADQVPEPPNMTEKETIGNCRAKPGN